MDKKNINYWQPFFELSLQLLTIAKPDGYLLEVNSAWEKTLEWKKEELLARPFIDFVYQDDREKTLSEFQKLLKGNAVHHFENRYSTKKKNIKHLAWKAVCDPQTKLIYAIGTDVTKERQVINSFQQFIQECALNSSTESESLKRINTKIKQLSKNSTAYSFGWRSLLTRQEINVLKLIIDEYTNKEIAQMLNLSVRTVETHRANIIKKLPVKSTVGLVKYVLNR